MISDTPIFILSGYTAGWGHFGVIVMVAFVSALFIVRDRRPDLMREMSRPNYQLQANIKHRRK